ncbi:hypothetical protein DPMN_140377 [Dreissena polymorpha]|uniref:Uncharacterized protein n=1 Tax=Dreissena polymorpha TaxID=45954 RepID=A0A9D4G7H4_DREPO|nr:hypothetical protein DPMN_140377 [Dreissena polymorpha]
MFRQWGGHSSLGHSMFRQWGGRAAQSTVCSGNGEAEQLRAQYVQAMGRQSSLEHSMFRQWGGRAA